MAIGREGVGIELARSAAVGCVTVTELTATLPGIRFPVDVSGGVPRFRHRRGTLQSIGIEVSSRALERYAAPRLRGLVSARTPDVWVGVRPAGASICVTRAVDPEDDPADLRAAPVVAFDVDVIAQESDLLLVVRHARGTGLPAAATAIAIACTSAILGGIARREGAAFLICRGARALAQALLPEAGARVPASDDVRWTSIAVHADAWILHGVRDAVAAAPAEDAVRAREVAAILREGDDALLDGEEEKARALYFEVLERAPRHCEIARRILEIDARTPGRAEAALATLAEARQAGVAAGDSHFGTTPGELLAEIGDVDAALASFERAGVTDPAPAISARAFELAARLVGDPEQGSRWLDQALARAPGSTSCRWLRVTRRIELGRLEDALADVQHLEAQAQGGGAKHGVWLRAGRAWQSAGLGARAGGLFERALRYAPDEPKALAGLGAGLIAEGRAARGVEVLARAMELAETRRAGTSVTAPILLELARGLAEELDDLPTAIARISTIDADADEAPIAHGLEGRWRARLGDVAGSALAFARMRELAASHASDASPTPRERTRFAWGKTDRVSTIVSLLVEAAELHRCRLDDPLGAQRYLAAALELRPHDVELRRAYREAGSLVAGEERAGGAAPDAPAASADQSPSFGDSEEASAVHPSNVSERALTLDLALAPDAPSTDEEIRAGVRCEELTRRLHANPADDAAAEELTSLLESLGRGHELLALLSARIEDAGPERRALLAPRARAVLARLAEQAEAAGRLDEASLYRGAMASLPMA
jgi:tetratricopeptide (TPR) repeat protein